MSNTQQFGRLVRESRQRRGWSLFRAAEFCGICDKSLEKIELGDTDPRLSTVLKIADALEIDLGELTSFTITVFWREKEG